MLNKLLPVILAPLALLMILLLVLPSKSSPAAEPPPPTQLQPTPSPLRPAPDAELFQRAQQSVQITRSKLSPGRKKLIPSMLTVIASKTFSNREHAELWIALIGIESGYDGTLRSSKGAVGLGQLLPQYRADFGSDCGVTDVTAADLQDDFTNASLSACYFRWLIEQNNGSVDLAMVAYVAGQYSEDHDKAVRGKQPGKDARDYVKAIHAKREGAK